MSSKSQMGWPSIGFFTLAAVHSALAGLLWWGWQKPRLDDAHEILARRDLGGNVEYSSREIQLLQQVWDAHPGFSRALLGKGTARFLEPTESGWMAQSRAHLAVRPETDRPTSLAIEARGAANDAPIIVKVAGSGFQRQVALVPGQPQKLDFAPTELPRQSILSVEMTASQSKPTATPTWAVRLIQNSAGNVREAQ